MNIDFKPKEDKSSLSEILPGMRVIYLKGELLEEDCPKDPIKLFEKWMLDTCESKKVCEPNAMTLATCTKDGFPSARVVLLKGFRQEGFIFYTNFKSKKSKDLMENPRAALVFNWVELERMVRVEGTVEKLSEEESEAYFNQRPRGAQIGAWASNQSSEAKNREEIEDQFKEMEKKWSGEEIVKKPDFWGGWIVNPLNIEFWQGRNNRLHDRILYSRADNKTEDWKIKRLNP